MTLEEAQKIASIISDYDAKELLVRDFNALFPEFSWLYRSDYVPVEVTLKETA